MSGSDPRGGSAAAPWLRTFAWSVRRELWEHRSIYLAPMAVAAFAALVHFISAAVTSHAERVATLADPAKAHGFMALYDGVIFAILMTGLVVGALYCVDALQGERRDRSILFWKSLPVSDLTGVLSKAFVPIVVLPVTVFIVIVATTGVMVTLQTLLWQLNGFDPRQLWARLELPFAWLCLAYGLPFVALWYAPLYAWILFVSGWARRAVGLFALAPLAALLIVERLAFPRAPRLMPLEAWLIGGFRRAFSVRGEAKDWIRQLSDLDAVRLYSTPGLWVGVGIAALLLLAAARLRHSRAAN